ncbi:MAG: saccharopine dehydrogenase NADP-binding domain-containing protein [Armatimonadetes bacterium]|nr:saccharopine dehydrogenase NADP-binding domain-containing protein [Armatimonadota bacterium]
MRVLLLGGTGRFGSITARRLVAADVVSEVAIAGRSPDRLTRAVSELGEKARTVQVDLRDEERLAFIAADYDIVVNTAGPEWEVLLAGLRGAIAAGRHYCDIGADGATAETQLQLDSIAKERDVVAVVGMGLDPGLSNLLAVRASRQFDRVEEVQLCYRMAPSELLSEALDQLRTANRIDPSWQLALNVAKGPVRVYRTGRWIDVVPQEHGVEITPPEGGSVWAYPVATPEPITLPRHLPPLVEDARGYLSRFGLEDVGGRNRAERQAAGALHVLAHARATRHDNSSDRCHPPDHTGRGFCARRPPARGVLRADALLRGNGSVREGGRSRQAFVRRIAGVALLIQEGGLRRKLVSESGFAGGDEGI